MSLSDIHKVASVQLKCLASGSWETGPGWSGQLSAGRKAFSATLLALFIEHLGTGGTK